MGVLQRAVTESHVTVKVANKFLFNTIHNIDNSLGLLNPLVQGRWDKNRDDLQRQRLIFGDTLDSKRKIDWKRGSFWYSEV